MSQNLFDALQGEIARVTTIERVYRLLKGGVGLPAATLMQGQLEAARQATRDQDALAMLRLYQELQQFDL